MSGFQSPLKVESRFRPIALLIYILLLAAVATFTVFQFATKVFVKIQDVESSIKYEFGWGCLPELRLKQLPTLSYKGDEIWPEIYWVEAGVTYANDSGVVFEGSKLTVEKHEIEEYQGDRWHPWSWNLSSINVDSWKLKSTLVERLSWEDKPIRQELLVYAVVKSFFEEAVQVGLYAVPRQTGAGECTKGTEGSPSLLYSGQAQAAGVANFTMARSSWDYSSTKWYPDGSVKSIVGFTPALGVRLQKVLHATPGGWLDYSPKAKTLIKGVATGGSQIMDLQEIQTFVKSAANHEIKDFNGAYNVFLPDPFTKFRINWPIYHNPDDGMIPRKIYFSSIAFKVIVDDATVLAISVPTVVERSYKVLGGLGGVLNLVFLAFGFCFVQKYVHHKSEILTARGNTIDQDEDPYLKVEESSPLVRAEVPNHPPPAPGNAGHWWSNCCSRRQPTTQH